MELPREGSEALIAARLLRAGDRLGMHSGEAGIGAVLNQAETILMAQQLAITEDEGVALRLGPGGPGVEKLSGHGGGEEKVAGAGGMMVRTRATAGAPGPGRFGGLGRLKERRQGRRWG